MAHFLAFLGVSIVVIVTPGPDTALTVRNTVLGSRRTGLLTALGVATGQAVWTLAAAAGIAALLVASEPASWRSSSRARRTSCGWACSRCARRCAARIRRGRMPPRGHRLP